MNCMTVWGGHGATNSYFTRPGLDVRVWSRARRAIQAGGGDVHLLSSCASGRITRMLLADVCGFGPALVDLSRDLGGLMKRNANSIRQARVVRQIGSRLDVASRLGACASTLISTYFAPTRSFTLCNAGHPPPLLYRSESQTWQILKRYPGQNPEAGARPGVVAPSEYQCFRMNLDVGDMVLSYGNVLTECRNVKGRTIGLSGLLDVVRSLDPAEPKLLAKRLIASIRCEHAENLADDDVTLLLCQVTNTPVRWRDNLMAPLRLLRPVMDQTSFV